MVIVTLVGASVIIGFLIFGIVKFAQSYQKFLNNDEKKG